LGCVLDNVPVPHDVEAQRVAASASRRGTRPWARALRRPGRRIRDAGCVAGPDQRFGLAESFETGCSACQRCCKVIDQEVRDMGHSTRLLAFGRARRQPRLPGGPIR
jgi:hypothetical protein